MLTSFALTRTIYLLHNLCAVLDARNYVINISFNAIFPFEKCKYIKNIPLQQFIRMRMIEIYILRPVNKLHTTLIHKDVILAQISIYDPK